MSLRSSVPGTSAPGTPICLTGGQPRAPGGQRIGHSTVCDNGERHGDRDDGVIGNGTAHLVQRQEGEHHRRRATRTEPAHKGDRHPAGASATATGTIRSTVRLRAARRHNDPVKTLTISPVPALTGDLLGPIRSKPAGFRLDRGPPEQCRRAMLPWPYRRLRLARRSPRLRWRRKSATILGNRASTRRH